MHHIGPTLLAIVVGHWVSWIALVVIKLAVVLLIVSLALVCLPL